MSTAIRWSSLIVGIGLFAGATAQDEQPEFPPHDKILKDYQKVVSTADGSGSLYGIWVRDKDGQMMAELPAGFDSQRHYIALTTPTGELFAGLQQGEIYGYWKRFDKRLAFIAPNVAVRSTGDQESKDAIQNHFVDRVVFDVAIACMGPGGQPMIDMDELLVGNASTFYGWTASGGNSALARVAKAKAFPQNVELAFAMPVAGGDLKTFHYSISNVVADPTYTPRAADERVGYFTTVWRDLGKYQEDKVWARNINRWHLQKADANLAMSPPKTPLTYYVEHTVPIRYRRWIKHGVEYWNKAFEQVGLSDAIEVRYQDKNTGAHMEKDPEDVRYNFIRWLSNDIGTAIGPSRAHPETGQILDADVVLTDGWIRAFWFYAHDFLPELALESATEETMQWYAEHPNWDPRVRLASPNRRSEMVAQIRQRRAEARVTGEPITPFHETARGDRAELRRLADLIGPDAHLCMAADCKAREMSMMGMQMALSDLLVDDDDKKKTEPMIDGIPESFFGPMLADLVAHEVGHTLGLRHNFKASSIYTMEQINSAEMKGKKAFTGSVMDYNPVNWNTKQECVQGDYAMIDLGPYDMWAIQFGYTFEDPNEVLKRVAEPELAYSTDYDTGGTDPLARRYDFAKNPLEFATSRMELSSTQRARLLEKFVADGDSWGKARRGYEITLGTQMGMVDMMANWIGGAFVYQDRKSDPNARLPIEPVPVEQQRAALDFVIANSFKEDSFGLTPDVLRHLTLQKWSDESDGWTAYDDSTWPLHDRISGFQASTLSMLLNPTTLRRVYDNEFLVPADQDAMTLPEVMSKVCDAVWTELGSADGQFTARKPMISSLRRALQQEHLQRLVDLAMASPYGASGKTIANLATAELRKVGTSIDQTLKNPKSLDPYSSAHLTEAANTISQALDATYVRNGGGTGGGGDTIIMMGREKSER